jgi:hypothetical protein
MITTLMLLGIVGALLDKWYGAILIVGLLVVGGVLNGLAKRKRSRSKK